MVDIDFFKKINDEHGHGVGDKVLKMVAKLLESKFGNKGSICRYGGEEFCVLLPGTGLEKTIEVTQDVRSTIKSYANHGHRHHEPPDGYRESWGLRHRAGRYRARGARRPGRQGSLSGQGAGKKSRMLAPNLPNWASEWCAGAGSRS
jgi:hypothetical protein